MCQPCVSVVDSDVSASPPKDMFQQVKIFLCRLHSVDGWANFCPFAEDEAGVDVSKPPGRMICQLIVWFATDITNDQELVSKTSVNISTTCLLRHGCQHLKRGFKHALCGSFVVPVMGSCITT